MVQAQVVRSDVTAKLSLYGPHKPVWKEIATTDFATMMNEAKQIAEPAQIEYLQYHDGDSWVIVEEQSDLDAAFNFAIARTEKTRSVIPSLIEGQAPQIFFNIKKAGEETPNGQGRQGKRAPGPKREVDPSKQIKKAFIRQGREAFNRLLKSQGIPVPELTNEEHKAIDKMDITADFDAPQGETKKGKRGPKAPKKDRVISWNKMLKELMLFGHDGTNEFNSEEFANKMRDFGAQVQQQWAESQGAATFERAEPKMRKLHQRAVVTTNLDNVIELAPGHTANIELQARNDTNKAWKDGCTISFAKKQKKLPKGAQLPLDAFTVQCEEALAASATGTFSVPITMGAETAVDNDKILEVNLSFFNEKNKHFGEMIPIKVKCVEAGNQPAAQSS